MKFEKEMNSYAKENVVKQPTKGRPNIFETSISNFFGFTIPFKNDEPQQKRVFGRFDIVNYQKLPSNVIC